MSVRTYAGRWARRITGGRFREVVRLRQDLALLRVGHEELLERLARVEEELRDVRIRAGEADDALARLTDGLAATSSMVDRDSLESWRLAHRVAQMTDVVFDRLAERPQELSA
jgi:hypothetical protein